MPTRQTPPPGRGWVYVDVQAKRAHPSWEARGWHNTRTGADLSRRQYDERYGRLARQGISTNEAQVRARRAAGLETGPARGRLRHTRLGDTDYFKAPHTLNGWRAKLEQLQRYGYTGVRLIYGRPGDPHSATGGWYSLTPGNIPYILNDLLLDFQYDGNSPVYHFRDIQLIAATRGAVATGVSRARAGY